MKEFVQKKSHDTLFVVNQRLRRFLSNHLPSKLLLIGLSVLERCLCQVKIELLQFGLPQSILGLQPRDKAAMLVVNTKEIVLLNLHQNRAHFPAERNAFVLDHQHGRRDVTCKPAIPGPFAC